MTRTPITCSAELRERTVRRGLDSQGQPGSRCQAVLSMNCTERLADPGIDPSVGSVGDSQDAALAERINGLFKAEVIHRRGPWRSFDCADYAPLERVEWFNNRRLLGPIGNIPPAEANAKFYAALETEAMAA
jgi:putative transposase